MASDESVEASADEAVEPAASKEGPQDQDPGERQSLSDEERLWAMLSHILTLSGVLLPVAGNLAGALVPYFLFRDRSRFVRFHALQSLCFQVFLCLGGAVLGLAGFVLGLLTLGIFWFVAVPLLALGVIGLALYVVLTGLQANEGRRSKYHYVGDFVELQVYREDWKPL